MTRFGVVLSSGGSRGVFAHTGFMAGLNDLQISVSASSGCSAGAIVGGMIASGTSLESWTDVLTHLRTDQFWTPTSAGRLAYRLLIQKGRGLAGLSDPRSAITFLESHLQAQTYEECIYPFSSIAVALDTVEKCYFDTGPLAPAIMASAAMPALYAPVEIDGRFYCDGAIYDLAPTEAICCRYDLDVLIIHHAQSQNFTTAGLHNALTQPWSMFSILQRLIFRNRPWYATGQRISFKSCPGGCRAVIVVVEPSLPDWTWPMTRGGESALTTARNQATDALGPILSILKTTPRSLLQGKGHSEQQVSGQAEYRSCKHTDRE